MFIQGCSAEGFLDTRKIFFYYYKEFILHLLKALEVTTDKTLTILEIHFVKEHQKLRFVH